MSLLLTLAESKMGWLDTILEFISVSCSIKVQDFNRVLHNTKDFLNLR